MDFHTLFRGVQIGKIFHGQCPAVDPAIIRKCEIHGRNFKLREKVIAYESRSAIIDFPIDRRSESGSVYMLVSVLEFQGLFFCIKKIEICGSGILHKRKTIIFRIHPKLRLENAVAALRPFRFGIDHHNCQGRGSIFHLPPESRYFHKTVIRNVRFIHVIPFTEDNLVIIQFTWFPDITALKLIGKFVQIVNKLILIRAQQVTFLQLTDRFPVDSACQSQCSFFPVILDVTVKFFRDAPIPRFRGCKRNPAVFHAGIPVRAVL